MFKEERTGPLFDWSMIGNLNEGRPNIGKMMDVTVYRLMQFTLRDVLISKVGVVETDHIFYESGKLAGKELYKNILTKKGDFNELIGELQEVLKELKIGVLRIEAANLENMTFTITMAEDLDCSGIPICDEQVCTYDEGFINGILSSHTGINFRVKEVDCWCSGDRVCRFDVKPMQEMPDKSNFINKLKRRTGLLFSRKAPA
jgi:predicted hydrocarbon binding protein